MESVKTKLPLENKFSQLLILAVLFFSLAMSGQATGDYRSKTSGNWDSLTSWDYYDGNTWVPATDYPGYTTDTGTVTITNGSNITLNTNITNSFPKLVVGEDATADASSQGTLTVNGIYTFTTPSILVSNFGLVT